MATNKRPVLIRVQPYNYEKLKAIADKNRRSVSNQLEVLMEQFEREHGQISSPVQNNNTGNGTFIANQGDVNFGV